MKRLLLGLVTASMLLHGCGLPPSRPDNSPQRSQGRGAEVVTFALTLLETGYRFGGKNPAAGLDCSGMVSYVFDKGAGLHVQGSAADLARQGHTVPADQLQPGDLLFFNTRHMPHSHVAIYIGDGRFIHAPNSGGQVRTDSLKNPWYAQRFEEARSLLD
ncbi:MAG: C40 family peptidase [Proteobacteria bacterium]|nr:C40 family peptidase [Pseudomonadota bacterium]HQR03620.1 C40 family peptidase [Rhodocyclaceae bacterium]